MLAHDRKTGQSRPLILRGSLENGAPTYRGILTMFQIAFQFFEYPLTCLLWTISPHRCQGHRVATALESLLSPLTGRPLDPGSYSFLIHWALHHVFSWSRSATDGDVMFSTSRPDSDLTEFESAHLNRFRVPSIILSVLKSGVLEIE